MAKRKFPLSFYNPITMFGAALAAVSFGLILFLMVIEMTSERSNSYLGIITFIILPVFLIFGLILIAFGIIREKRLKSKGKITERKFPLLDLNDPQHRRSLIIFVGTTILLLAFSAFGSFKAYEYTESDEFCGTVCHKVMEPEHTAYLFSPHSRVGCVQCHIGSGADWFVKSKISGSYQVYSVVFNKYPRPIPTPIENLRPAQETCEKCHWPKHFFGEKKVDYNYYLSDEQNTKSTLTMMLKTGGGYQGFANASGIHYHMNIANEVFYYTSDKGRTQIPYIVAKNINGKVTVYRDKSINVDKKFPENDLRKMDCIDCHNRPSHVYNQPDKMVNLYLSAGMIDASIPFIKSIGVQALEQPQTKRESAIKNIEEFISSFYKNHYPQVWKEKQSGIETAVKKVIEIYNRSYFPEMKVSWREYPVNLGHMYSNGCFRCHDGNHVSEDGKTISNDCNVCHTITRQKLPDSQEVVSLDGMVFQHPGNPEFGIEGQLCIDCHGAKKTRKEG
ncbi:MAG: NapC/NirT family cytochrome c [Ignavibacteriaceae bacterium]|jgi:amino acid transporter|nr:NapC/NirT family cytochrome c [Ignavibacteriaceae bacterium]